MLIETIPAALHEQRLDRVVALIADISRASTATLIELGGVTLDGIAGVAGKVKVKEGQEITINTAMIPEKELPQGDASVVLDVVFADDDVIVVNKAPGIVVHPGAGNFCDPHAWQPVPQPSAPLADTDVFDRGGRGHGAALHRLGRSLWLHAAACRVLWRAGLDGGGLSGAGGVHQAAAVSLTR